MTHITPPPPDPAPLSYATPRRLRWGTVVLAALGVAFGTAAALFGFLGIWGLIADWINPTKDRTVPIHFVLMIVIGFGVGGWVIVRSICALRRGGRSN